MPSLLRSALLLLLTLITAACASQTMVALLPNADGAVGRVAVQNRGGAVSISAPYQATTVENAEKAPSRPTDVGREYLYRTFADALSVCPSKPIYFRFYFARETIPTRESLERLPAIVAAILERNSGYVSVIGHADTLGVRPYNFQLTMLRALAVRDLLVERGVPVVTVYPSWVGEDLLFIKTADEVWERKNRGVEVVVR